jgi:uncharacterized membrane protein
VPPVVGLALWLVLLAWLHRAVFGVAPLLLG